MTSDDVLSRLAPSLEKHRNCDIIDLRPGNGLWSEKLHEIVKPRSHLLIEDRDSLYLPFLHHLLEKPDSRYQHVLLPTDTPTTFDQIVHAGLLPYQEIFPEGDPRRDRPNDSLLLIANLGRSAAQVRSRGHYYGTFGSIWGFLRAIQKTSELRAYGRIRMLIWAQDSEKNLLIPRCVGNRLRKALEADLWLEDAFEIAGLTATKSIRQRDHDLNMLSTIRVVKGMAERGVKAPSHRKSPIEIEAEAAIAAGTEAQPRNGLVAKRDWNSELEALEKAYKNGDFKRYVGEMSTALESDDAQSGRSPEGLIKKRRKTVDPRYSRMLYLRVNSNRQQLLKAQLNNLVEVADQLAAMPVFTDGPTSLQQQQSSRPTELGRKLDGMKSTTQQRLELYLDDRKALQDKPPLLFWDRRIDEPLLVQANEFHPQMPLALLDLRPKAIDARLESGENRSMLELLIRHLWQSPRRPILPSSLEVLGDGATKALAYDVPSLRDPAQGGHSDLTQLRSRMLRPEMFVDIIMAWHRWPWRPTRAELHDRWAWLDEEEE